jgi:hypothetical protein
VAQFLGRAGGYDAEIGNLEQDKLVSISAYWKKKEEDHHFNALIWAESFFLVLLLALTTGAYFLYYPPSFLEILNKDLPVVGSDGSSAIAEAIQHVVLFGTIVTFFIWGLRQVVRLWVYHEDLRTDAIERIGMLATFEALKGAGWLARGGRNGNRFGAVSQGENYRHQCVRATSNAN